MRAFPGLKSREGLGTNVGELPLHFRERGHRYRVSDINVQAKDKFSLHRRLYVGDYCPGHFSFPEISRPKAIRLSW